VEVEDKAESNTATQNPALMEPCGKLNHRDFSHLQIQQREKKTEESNVGRSNIGTSLERRVGRSKAASTEKRWTQEARIQ